MKKFSYEANGYNRSEVIDFIDYVINETEFLIKKIKQQSTEIDELKNKLQNYREQEDKYTDIVNSALDKCNTITEVAEYKAECIINDAKEDASKILNDTLKRAELIEKKKTIMENSFNKYKDKLRNLIDEENTVLDKIDDLVLDDE